MSHPIEVAVLQLLKWVVSGLPCAFYSISFLGVGTILEFEMIGTAWPTSD